MLKVPRHLYVTADLLQVAYEDCALQIEEGQTISQPYIVALMLESLALDHHDRVLEVGTGSGYAAAVLAEVVEEVFTIERNQFLAHHAQQRLKHDGYGNVQVRHGDGSFGWPEAAPFDGIVVAASCAEIPDALCSQLAVGGRLVIPVKSGGGNQRLKCLRRVHGEDFEERDLGAVRFVPLISG